MEGVRSLSIASPTPMIGTVTNCYTAYSLSAIVSFQAFSAVFSTSYRLAEPI